MYSGPQKNTAPYSSDKLFREGFQLCFTDLENIEKIIIESFKVNGSRPDFKVHFTFLNGKNVESFNSIEAFIDSPRNHLQTVSAVRIVASAIRKRAVNTLNPIEQCIVSYGSQNALQSRNKSDSGRVSLRVIGNSQDSLDLYELLELQIKGSLISGKHYDVSEFVSLNKILSFFLCSIVFVSLLFFLSAIRIHDFSSNSFELANAQSKLELLYEDAPSLETNDEKISFLYEERMLQLEIESLTEQPNSTVNYSFDIISFLRILMCYGLALLSLYSLSRHFPQENFVWGNYKKWYSNTKSKRQKIFWVVISAFLINIATSIFGIP